MSLWLFVTVNVAIAGLVGGVTNHLAIKMLFHPRQPWMVFGKRLPFTPGLIPKRKQEIAVSLGNVVAEYLVTPDAFRELFGKSEFRLSVINKLYSWIRQEMGESATVGSCLRRWAGEERAEQWLAVLPKQAGEWSGQAFERLWQQGAWGSKRLHEIIPGWRSSNVDAWALAAAGWGLEALKKQMLSDEGQVLLRKLASGLIERQKGFIGMLAGFFVDEDKLAARLTPFLAEQLESEWVRTLVGEWLGRRILELGNMTLEEALGKMVKGDLPPEQQMRRWIEEGLPWEKWAGRAEQFPVGSWVAEREETWQGWLSAAVDAALELVSGKAHQLIEALKLPDMVRVQVERFPVERLEQVILSISGREFRAITWLGVLLGGMIGLIQSFLIRLWPGG